MNINNQSFLGAYALLLRLHGSKSEPADILHEMQVTPDEFSFDKATLYSKKISFWSKVEKVEPSRINRYSQMCIGFTKNGDAFIFRHSGSAIGIISPDGNYAEVCEEDFLSEFGGLVYLVKSKQSALASLAKFDFSWFIPAIIRYRKELAFVVILSLATQLIALLTPLFFQVVTDKVLVHNANTTLNVFALGLLLTIAFDAFLTTVRSYALNHTSNRMDVSLGSSLYRHLVSLPSSYFAVRRVGDSVARVHELENIRNFLTNNSVTLLLDAVFSFVFLALMAYYSLLLTCITLVSVLLYGALSFLVVPVLRKRLDDKFSKGSESQSFLVESLSGIDTLKSLSLEPSFHSQWDKRLAAYVRSSFSVTNLSSIAGTIVSTITKLSTLAIMYFGAQMVMNHELTIGQLIAFNMLSGQVANPIMRIANLWSEFQQVGISMERLGDILNAPSEVNTGKSSIKHIDGNIELRNITFKYRFDGKPVLQDVSITIPANQTIGLVGRSGSGKSTLTKLIQGLYTPNGGAVLVDGIDISSLNPATLRSKIGVVLQENFLFNRTIRENIALATPNANLEDVIAAAKLAGAHDFIGELPLAYDTIIEERGASLSGGQRQRIAIARALIGNPRILIFDEATSALDYESEKIIQDNMAKISEGRTVIIIAHRLSAVRHAHCIYVLDHGVVKESGSHDELLLADGIYSHLNAIQGGNRA